jgi:hypothetical protein
MQGKTTIMLNMLTRADAFPYSDGSFYKMIVVISEKTTEPEWQRLLELHPGRFVFYTELTEEVFEDVKNRQNKDDGMYLIVTDDTADALDSCGLESRIIKMRHKEQEYAHFWYVSQQLRMAKGVGVPPILREQTAQWIIVSGTSQKTLNDCMDLGIIRTGSFQKKQLRTLFYKVTTPSDSDPYPFFYVDCSQAAANGVCKMYCGFKSLVHPRNINRRYPIPGEEGALPLDITSLEDYQPLAPGAPAAVAPAAAAAAAPLHPLGDELERVQVSKIQVY